MEKILTINCFSDNGSISKIISDIENVNPAYDYYHCYQVGPRNKDIHEYLTASWRMTQFYYALARVAGIKYGIGNIPTKRLIQHIKTVNPDLIHVHCPNFYNINLYKLFKYLKKTNMPVVITNHAEFYYTGNCPHAMDCMKFQTGCYHCDRQFDTVHPYLINRTHLEWKKMKAAFQNAKNFMMTVVSPWQAERIELSPVIPSSIPVRTILNGVNTEVFNGVEDDKRLEVRNKICNELKISQSKIAIQVTSLFTDDKENLKGGWYLIEIARRLPDILFIIVGNTKLGDNCCLPDNIRILGNISDQRKLAEYYQAADITVLTSKKETFGMVCAESLCCGTPVVSFKAGGTESISLKEFSSFADFGDIDSLVTMIKLSTAQEWNHNRISIEAKAKYSRELMGRAYGKVYNDLICKS